MCMVSLYLLAILCCHTIDWDIFLRYWCLSQLLYYTIGLSKSVVILKFLIKKKENISAIASCHILQLRN